MFLTAFSHLHVRHWADTYQDWLAVNELASVHSATFPELVDGRRCRCNQSRDFFSSLWWRLRQTFFLAIKPASCQQRLNSLTAAPCRQHNPAQVPYIVPSIFNEEWKADRERGSLLQAEPVPTVSINYKTAARMSLTWVNHRFKLQSTPSCVGLVSLNTSVIKWGGKQLCWVNGIILTATLGSSTHTTTTSCTWDRYLSYLHATVKLLLQSNSNNSKRRCHKTISEKYSNHLLEMAMQPFY